MGREQGGCQRPVVHRTAPMSVVLRRGALSYSISREEQVFIGEPGKNRETAGIFWACTKSWVGLNALTP